MQDAAHAMIVYKAIHGVDLPLVASSADSLRQPLARRALRLLPPG